jgi:hypothetical protein
MQPANCTYLGRYHERCIMRVSGNLPPPSLFYVPPAPRYVVYVDCGHFSTAVTHPFHLPDSSSQKDNGKRPKYLHPHMQTILRMQDRILAIS